MTTVYIIRHGSTPANTAGVYHGITDTPLLPMGEAQAQRLAQRFADIHLDAVYTSTLQRAKNTAAPLCAQKGITPVALRELCELDGGQIEDMAITDIETNFPGLLETMMDRLPEFVAPGGESMRQVYDRLTGTIDRLAQEHRGQSIAIVSHGCALQTYLAHAQGLGFAGTVRNMLRNTAVSQFVYDDAGTITPVFIGDDSHLDDSLRLVPANV